MKEKILSILNDTIRFDGDKSKENAANKIAQLFEAHHEEKKTNDGKIKYVCTECGSDKICWDTTARWNEKEQKHELSGVQDYAYCYDCGEETTVKEIKI